MGKKVRVRGNMTPPIGAEVKEIYDGKTVYVIRKPNLIPTPAVDGAGNEAWVVDPRTGSQIRRRMVLAPDPDKPFIEEEFVLMDLGNGVVKKNKLFRRPEGERAPRGSRASDQAEVTIDSLSGEVHALTMLVKQLLQEKAALESKVHEATEDAAGVVEAEGGEAPAKPKRTRKRTAKPKE
jgi:hypothetical protein